MDELKIAINDEEAKNFIISLLAQETHTNIFQIVSVILIPITTAVMIFIISMEQNKRQKIEFKYKIFLEKLSLYDELLTVYRKMKKGGFLIENDLAFLKLQNIAFIFNETIISHVNDFKEKFIDIDRTNNDFVRNSFEENMTTEFEKIIGDIKKHLNEKYEEIGESND